MGLLPQNALPLFFLLFPFYYLWFGVRFSLNGLFPGSTSTRQGEIIVPIHIIDDKVLGEILVGTPKEEQKEQLFTVSFNTLSSEFWLASIKACPKSDCTNHPFKGFDGLRSKTYSTSSNPFESKSDYTKISGVISKDFYTLGREGKEVVVEQQEFGEIRSFKGASPTHDGMLGLNLVTTATNAPVWAMATQFKISHEFGFYIHREPKETEDGKLIFGGEDEGLIEKKLGSHPVIQEGNTFTGWNIEIDKIVIEWKNGKKEEMKLTTMVAAPVPSVKSILLTGTDFLELNKKIFDNSHIVYTNGYYFNCDSNWEVLPTVTIVMKGTSYRMDPKEYVIDYTSAVENTCGTGFTSGARKYVQLGRNFMKKFYTKYDIEKKEVKFALAREMHVKY